MNASTSHSLFTSSSSIFHKKVGSLAVFLVVLCWIGSSAFAHSTGFSLSWKEFRSSRITTRAGNEQQWHSRSELGVAVLFQSIIEWQSIPEGFILMAHAHATQVLDQIHQQPMSLSLSMVSLPAPESVVDSFLVKTPGKSVRSQPEDDVTQYHETTQAKISRRLLTKGKVNSIYVPSPYLMECKSCNRAHE